MRVLVTGGSSLLAGCTAQALRERGDDVICFQRRRAAVDVEQVLGDVRDGRAVERAMRGCDAVVHAAAKVGVVGSWEEYRSTNVDGTRHVLDAALRLGVGKLVHVSTPSVAHGGAPIVGETAGAPITGRRRAWYAESKSIAERAAAAAASEASPIVIVRPHLVWGPGDTQLVGRILERARSGRLALVGQGAALVDTTYIDNAASALVAALDAVGPAARCNGRAYVIANGEPRPIRDLVSGICRAAGVRAAPRHVPRRVALAAGTVVESVFRLRRTDAEPPLTRFLAEQLGTAHWFDPRPPRDDLGWAPTVTIDEGLARLRDWFAEQPGDVRHDLA